MACLKQLQNYLAFLFLFMPFFYSFGLSMDVVLDGLIEHSLPWEQRLIMACFYSVRRRQLRCRLRQLQLSLQQMREGARLVQSNKTAKSDDDTLTAETLVTLGQFRMFVAKAYQLTQMNVSSL